MFIEIKIGKEDYAITSDKRNFILARKTNFTDKKTKEKKVGWREEWFYGTLGGLLAGLFELKLRATDAKTMNELYEAVRMTKLEVTEYVENYRNELRSITLEAND